MAVVIACPNQKGGTGETTTATNRGIGLAHEGKRVLLVDADLQGSLSISLGYTQPHELPVTLSDIMEKVLEEKPLQRKKAFYITQWVSVSCRSTSRCRARK